jgi:hypothetical protein
MSYLKQSLGEVGAEQGELHKGHLFIEKSYFDPEYPELRDLRRERVNVELEILTWRHIELVEDGLYKTVIGNVLLLIADAAPKVRVEWCLSRSKKIVGHLRTRMSRN